MIQLSKAAAVAAAAAAAATTKTTTTNKNVNVIMQNTFIFCTREKSKILPDW
jgi:Flp pilus assembly protein TadG